MNAPAAPAATLVIFGATGDLTRRLLAPALVHMMRDGLLDPGFRVIGVGRRNASGEGLCASIDSFFAENGVLGGVEDQEAWSALRARFDYVQSEFDDQRLYAWLAEELSGAVIFYLATAPSFFGSIADALGDAGLLDESDGFRRLAVEKPFGEDLQTARSLNERLLTRMSERQIYRVDHFLGKETVQNIMVARFANVVAGAVWDARHIDHVQITVAEAVTVGGRGAFYDSTGALRDMVPNHLFQLMALIAMEPPASFDAEAIRDEKARVLRAVRAVRPEDAVRGRYLAGEADGAHVAGYRREDDVAADSRTETFAAVKVEIDAPRWAGTPFYLRTGKAMGARDSHVALRFRDVPASQFSGVEGDLPANELVMQLQPRDGLHLGIVVKRPGPEVTTAAVALDFCYADAFGGSAATGYETLLYDLMTGDQTLFQRADMIEASWAAIEPLLEAWRVGEPDVYAAGTTGPDAAEALIARDGRSWRVTAAPSLPIRPGHRAPHS